MTVWASTRAADQQAAMLRLDFREPAAAGSYTWYPTFHLEPVLNGGLWVLTRNSEQWMLAALYHYCAEKDDESERRGRSTTEYSTGKGSRTRCFSNEHSSHSTEQWTGRVSLLRTAVLWCEPIYGVIGRRRVRGLNVAKRLRLLINQTSRNASCTFRDMSLACQVSYVSTV